MTSESIKTFEFSSERQTEFAELSGDWNPMHMSPVLARRTQLGRPVVHGMHTLLRALDSLAASSPELAYPSKLTAKFLGPVYVGETVAMQIVERSERKVRLQARLGETIAVDLTIVPGEEGPRGDFPLGPVDGRGTCRELSLEEMAGRSGTIAPATTAEHIRLSLPDASRWLGVERVAALLGLSRLVGMECPGLHSMFSGFAIEFPVTGTPSSLQYHVAKVHERFRLLKIDVQGLGVRGSVEAFARQPPIGQKSITELSSVVGPKEFAGQRALIVGGSRGLGELTAKLIAAGGGHPVITYAVGKDDAERVGSEIKQWGGECDILKYDARMAPLKQLAQLNGPVSHLYYYATCPIFGLRTKDFDAGILEEFLQFYVRGFYDLCAALKELSPQSISVFYPSTVAVEERPRNMTEYSMAKAAAEILCGDLNRSWPTIHITSVRLPRLLTDQTTTVAPVRNADAVETILPIVRKVQGHRF
jgi:acyl dehydratase/NAD(P)-dependent dehydrogenase (short-subunit alcohol dehydrogenase family)